VLAGHASGSWRSALGAGVPYNREKKENLFLKREKKVFFAGTWQKSSNK